MNSFLKFLSITLLAFLFSACGGSKKEDNAVLNEKKSALQKLIKERSTLNEKISKLEEEIARLDKNSGNTNAMLVGVSPVQVQSFQHYIDLRGRIDAENISYITPRGMGGQVKNIYIREGDRVSKGQLVLKLDDAIYRQQLTAAKQQLETIKTQLSYARNLNERQNNLWEKGIGTEVQVLSSKTSVETLQNQLKSAEEQVQVAAEQLKTTDVYSDVDGVAETVMVKPGELFGGMGQIKIVNTSNLKVTASIPENYITRVKKGTPVVIEVAEAGKSINSSISLVGQTIEPTQRGFIAEARINADPVLKPYQTVVMKINDYTAENAVVIPIKTVQSDENNKYVFILTTASNGKQVASKRVVVLGEIYNESVEIKSGLTGGEQLITAGYQNLYEGQTLTTAGK
jgi:RND family efflux transporter MFP subunit